MVAELASGQTVGAGEVRVAVAAAAFTYFNAFVPAHQEALGLPGQVGLGFDFSGTVTEVAPDVNGFAIGDRVAGLHVDITAPVHAHSEALVIAAGALALVPDALPLDVAAAVPFGGLDRTPGARPPRARARESVGGRCGRRRRWVVDRAGEAVRAGT